MSFLMTDACLADRQAAGVTPNLTESDLMHICHHVYLICSDSRGIMSAGAGMTPNVVTAYSSHCAMGISLTACQN